MGFQWHGAQSEWFATYVAVTSAVKHERVITDRSQHQHAQENILSRSIKNVECEYVHCRSDCDDEPDEGCR
jgi:hypothetical protein